MNLVDDLLAVGAPILARGDRLLDRLVAAAGDASRTVKFLRGRAAFRPDPSDVFIASYPRSGTTWTQLLVYLLVTGRTELDFEHICRVSPWWERSLAWRSDANDGFEALDRPRVFKTHLPYRWLPSRGRLIYVHRNPDDVAVSYYHLYRAYLEYRGDFERFFQRFVRGDLQYGSWFKHVAGWMRHSDEARVLAIQYEQLHADPGAAVERIAGFLGLEVDSGRVSELVEAASFDAMKCREHLFDHAGELQSQWGVSRGQFLRRGRVADGAGYVTAQQRAVLDEQRRQAIRNPEVEWNLPSFLH